MPKNIRLNGVFRVHWDSNGYLYKRTEGIFGYTYAGPLLEAFKTKCESFVDGLRDDGYYVEVSKGDDGKSIKIFARRNPDDLMAAKLIRVWIEKDNG